MAYTNDLVVDCLQFERAFCTADCPFSLDIRDFIGKVQQGRFNVAYKTYQNTVGFPGIVTALCHEPCKQVCPLKSEGGSISLKLLELATIEHARNTEPDQYNMPQKNKSVAIIGGGISGLACALRLVTKKYQVTVFEKSERIGGHLHSLMSSEKLLAEIDRQFMHEKYTLHTNTEITSLDNLQFNAIYIATGKNGNDFGLSRSNEGAFASSMQGVFLGGSLTGADSMQAMSQGLSVTAAIETFLKIGKMNHPILPSGTKLPHEAVTVSGSLAITPANGVSYSKEEAISEAKRCLKCSCDACVRYSPLMHHYQKFPKRITEEVEVTITPSSVDGSATLATRLISACNHCGLCKEVCPKDIDTGAFLLKSHKTMREKGKMPWAFHEFYLRDMEFSNTDAALVKTPLGFETSSHMFFPGCQLGASDPRYVTYSYKLLTGLWPDTAMMLGCCGAPAEWAGDEPLHKSVLDKIKDNWNQLGKPTAIFACPTCQQMFRNHLPEINSVSLYQVISQNNVPLSINENGAIASVFDPCASRHAPELQKVVRELAKKAGFCLEPLPMEGKMAECCSYGGQIAIAHPPLTNSIISNRISQNEYPYITYCSNCRDIFANAGKPALHILDLIFRLNSDTRKSPGLSERRMNKTVVKEALLNEFWKEKTIMQTINKPLIISNELKEKLNREMILESDVLGVIEFCEQSGIKLFNAESGTYTGHNLTGNMTCWVEYLNNKEEFTLVNAYCHRMKIEE